MFFKPLARKSSDLFQCALFLKQMSCAWNDSDFIGRPHHPGRCPAQFDNVTVEFTNDEQCWRGDFAEMVVSKIGPASTRDDGTNTLWAFCSSNESGGRGEDRKKSDFYLIAAPSLGAARCPACASRAAAHHLTGTRCR